MPEFVGFQTMVILNLYGMNFDAVVAKSSQGALAAAATALQSTAVLKWYPDVP